MLLLDTNVVSELRKVRSGRVERAFLDWESRVDASELYISVATIHEMEYGVLRLERKDIAQAKILREWLDNNVLAAFEGHILGIDIAIAKRSACLHSPKTRPFLDSLIAATAYVHKMPVVTRNGIDFRGTGVRIIDPWSTQIQS